MKRKGNANYEKPNHRKIKDSKKYSTGNISTGDQYIAEISNELIDENKNNNKQNLVNNLEEIKKLN